MKRLAIVVLVAGLVGAISVAMASGAEGGRKGAFAGIWEATDALDGSSMTMWVDPDRGQFEILWYDQVASIICPPDQAANIFGAGKAQGYELAAQVSGWYLSETPTHVGTGSWTITYHESTDTLTDPDGNIWHRR